MEILDITVDLETLALTPNAAIIQIAAVAWKRSEQYSPFFLTSWKDSEGMEHSSLAQHYIYDHTIDLRSCVALGMDFDQKTVDWWSRNKEAVKAKVLGMSSSHDISLRDDSLPRIDDALKGFMEWARDLADELGEQGCAIRLWSQGSDFDIAILRNACHKCGLTELFDKVFPHTSFRDARTFILEAGKCVTPPHFHSISADVFVPDKNIYQSLPSFDGDNLTHDALYDCQKTSWQVWSVMKRIRE